MARYLTSNSLIESVRRRAMIPSSQSTFTDADLLAFANEELDMGIIPFVLSFHEDYFLKTDNIPMHGGRTSYPIPYRAIGNKLRDVSFKDFSNTIYEMTRVTVGDAPFYQYGGGTGINGSGIRVFYVKGNEIALLPEDMPNTTGFLTMSYYLRPNSLVAENRIAYITAIDRNTGIISLSTLPTIFLTTEKYDLIQIKSPNRSLAIDISPISISTLDKTITLNITDIPEDYAIGDYIALAEESIIPQVPTDLHSMLAQRIACRCLEALGDQAGLQAANAKLQEMEQKAGGLVDNRIEDAPLKINIRHSFLKRYRTYFRR